MDGNQSNAQLGCSVSGAGDVNGDGYDDVIVGAKTFNNDLSNEGRAYVYHGSTAGLSATPAWTGEGDQAGAEFGFSVAGAGDVNNDGYDDVIVSAWGFDNGHSSEGRAYLYLGSAAGVSASPVWMDEGNQTSAGYGYSVAGAGDVNGDGYDDVIVGTPLLFSRGRAYLYFGSATGLSATPDWTATGSGPVHFANQVATAGDVNGDCFADIIVGAREYQSFFGAAFVYLGSAGGPSLTADWTKVGPQDNARFGWSLGTAGDVNADGFDDVIVGARDYDNGQTNEGRAFVYTGSGAGICLVGPPSISCPADITVTCASPGGAAVEFAVSATDNSDPNPSIVSAPPSGSTFQAGTTTVTSTATDFDGNQSSCSFTVTVVLDTEAPSITAPAAIIRSTGEGATLCGAVIGDGELGVADGADACSEVAVTRSGVPAGNLFPVGTTVITYTATDAAGNARTATQLVTVVDDTPPSVSAPSAVTAVALPSADGCGVTLDDDALGAAVATDNCAGVTVARSGVPAGGFFPIGTTVVTYTATDAAGNTATAEQSVTVSEPPGSVAGSVVASCPSPNTPLFGVRVDAFDTLGTLVGTAVTDEDGAFRIDSLPSGMIYTVSTVTPLGYQAVAEDAQAAIACGVEAPVQFQMTCLPIAFDPRSAGFWKHQVGVATGGRGTAQVDGPMLCAHLDLIEERFNSNAVNQVIVYEPPASGQCADKLEVAKTLLNLKGSVAMIARARQQLMALLLNVAAGYVSLTEIVSTDGATLSQAITFCDLLIDNPSGDHELAKTIADLINNGQQVGAGVIPLSTDDIAYKASARAPAFAIDQNQPNPFRESTRIGFRLPADGDYTLTIYNAAGQVVRAFDGRGASGGNELVWDGIAASGRPVAGGVYLYRLQSGSRAETKRLTIMR